MCTLKKIRISLFVHILLSIAFLVPILLHSQSYGEGPHLDRTKLPQGCASCHKGHGIFNTPMLPERKDVFCFRCHGHNIHVEQTKRAGLLTEDITPENIQNEFEKPYHHPIENIGVHEYGEVLPETDPTAARHAECVDCHHHHYVTQNNKFVGIKGVNRQGTQVENITAEYELCFKCHSYSANLPPDQMNKAELFDISNPSYHPVISQGKNNNVPSLLYPLTSTSIIECTDCHNNNDPLGPQGPHGSDYKYLLKKNFTDNDGSEGTFQYELCYSCHIRTSILGNESFEHHKLHITEIGTSCRTCHNPHGSLLYPHLIEFATTISPSSEGRLEYRVLGFRAGECYLSCHGKDHNPAVYPFYIE